MKSYRIYFKNGLHDAPKDARFSFYDPHTDRTLLYLESATPRGYKLLPATAEFSEAEKKWLLESMHTVEYEIFVQDEQSFKDYLNELLTEFENNLKKAAAEEKK